MAPVNGSAHRRC